MLTKTKYNDGQNDLVCETYYYNDGSVSEYYYLNGKFHRTDGPARIWYYEDGGVGSEEYWLNDNILTREIRNDRINKALFKGRYVEVGDKLFVKEIKNAKSNKI